MKKIKLFEQFINESSENTGARKKATKVLKKLGYELIKTRASDVRGFRLGVGGNSSVSDQKGYYYDRPPHKGKASLTLLNVSQKDMMYIQMSLRAEGIRNVEIMSNTNIWFDN